MKEYFIATFAKKCADLICAEKERCFQASFSRFLLPILTNFRTEYQNKMEYEFSYLIRTFPNILSFLNFIFSKLYNAI